MPRFREDLIGRLRARTARVGVIGLGYVGLPLAVEFAKVGFETVGIDLDDAKVRRILSEVRSILRSLGPPGTTPAKAGFAGSRIHK